MSGTATPVPPNPPPIQGPGTLPEYPPGSAVLVPGALAACDGFDYRKALWLAVVVERIREAGDVPVGTPCDDADFALARFDKTFGAPT